AVAASARSQSPSPKPRHPNPPACNKRRRLRTHGAWRAGAWRWGMKEVEVGKAGSATGGGSANPFCFWTFAVTLLDSRHSFIRESAHGPIRSGLRVFAHFPGVAPGPSTHGQGRDSKSTRRSGSRLEQGRPGRIHGRLLEFAGPEFFLRRDQ